MHVIELWAFLGDGRLGEVSIRKRQRKAVDKRVDGNAANLSRTTDPRPDLLGHWDW